MIMSPKDRSFEDFLEGRHKQLIRAINKQKTRQHHLDIDIGRLSSLLKKVEYLKTKVAPAGKHGRPGKWKGEFGLTMVKIVKAMQEANPEKYDTIKAALSALREGTSSPWHKYKLEDLEVRHHEARDYWEPILQEIADLEAEIDKALDIADRRPPGMSDDEVKALISPRKA